MHKNSGWKGTKLSRVWGRIWGANPAFRCKYLQGPAILPGAVVAPEVASSPPAKLGWALQVLSTAIRAPGGPIRFAHYHLKYALKGK
jgi:hypothetical protein